MHHVFPVIINRMFRSVQFSLVILLDDPEKLHPQRRGFSCRSWAPLMGSDNIISDVLYSKSWPLTTLQCWCGLIPNLSNCL